MTKQMKHDQEQYTYCELPEEGMAKYLDQLNAVSPSHLKGKDFFSICAEIWKTGLFETAKQLKKEIEWNKNFRHYFQLSYDKRLRVDKLNLVRTNFKNADLRGMVFNGGNFTGADFTDTTLPEDMFHPGLTEKQAIFIGVKGLSSNALKAAQISLPDNNQIPAAIILPEDLPSALEQGRIMHSHGYQAAVTLRHMALQVKNEDLKARYKEASNATLNILCQLPSRMSYILSYEQGFDAARTLLQYVDKHTDPLVYDAAKETLRIIRQLPLNQQPAAHIAATDVENRAIYTLSQWQNEASGRFLPSEVAAIVTGKLEGKGLASLGAITNPQKGKMKTRLDKKTYDAALLDGTGTEGKKALRGYFTSMVQEQPVSSDKSV